MVMPHQWRRLKTLFTGAKIFLPPPPTKSAEFKAKNKGESAKDAKAEHFALLLCSTTIKRLSTRNAR